MSERPIEELVAELRDLIDGAKEDEATGHEDSDALANLGLTMQHEGARLLDALDALRADAASLRAEAIEECIAHFQAMSDKVKAAVDELAAHGIEHPEHDLDKNVAYRMPLWVIAELRALLAPPVRDEVKRG